MERPIQAILLDLDGVITQTAKLHAKAWKIMFDEFLQKYEEDRPVKHEFVVEKDYPEYVDGKPRIEGIVSYLNSINITLPQGNPEDPPGTQTIEGLAKRKNDIFQSLLTDEGVEIFKESVQQVRKWKEEGYKTAVVSSSKNCRTILKSAGLTDLFDATVDGLVAQKEHLKGKPEPDTFLYAAQLLNAAPSESMVVEDSLAGIAAGRKGNFGLVVGINQDNNQEIQQEYGADCSVKALDEVILENMEINTCPDSENPWFVSREGFNPAQERTTESILSFGNGFIGSRNSLEENYSFSEALTSIGGVYQTIPGTSRNELSKAPDWTRIQIFIDDDLIDLISNKILTHKRYLDLKKGLVVREWRIKDDLGRITFIKIIKFISHYEKHHAYKSILIKPKNHTGKIKVIAAIEAGNNNSSIVISQKEETMLFWEVEQYNISMAQKSFFPLKNGFYKKEAKGEVVFEEWEWKGEPGKEYKIESMINVFLTTNKKELIEKSKNYLERLNEDVIKNALHKHSTIWNQFWDQSGITIKGDPKAQVAVNFAMYHLITNGKFSGVNCSIGARGLAGIAYQGHVFWDTEMFLLPFFLFTAPDIARNLLLYRYNTLEGARKNAKNEGHQGVCFAWESTDSGLETTPLEVVSVYGEVIPIYTSQYEIHITPDIAYAVWQYWTVTRDLDFLVNYGAELIFETARFSAGTFEKGDDGLYHINDVVGPDEYHERINDNAYTNIISQYNLEVALKTFQLLKDQAPDALERVCKKIDIQNRELENWEEIKDKVYTGYNPDKKIYEQFKGYFDLEFLDLKQYEPRSTAIDVLLGREKVKGSQIIKQADVLMFMFLFKDRFPVDVISTNYDYYEPRTAHGSSLSPSIYSIMAANTGKTDLAYHYFEQNAQIDLDDRMGNASGGVHIAAIGGTWMSVVMGFAGLQILEDQLLFIPHLPPKWEDLEFSLCWRQQRIKIQLKKEIISFEVAGNSSVRVSVGAKENYQELSPGKIFTCKKDQEWKWNN